MKTLLVSCDCGKTFTTEIDPEKLQAESWKGGIISLLVSHEDHLVTLYVDSNYQVRGVERVILVDKDRSAVAVSEELTADQIARLVDDAWSESNPMKDYARFILHLVYRIRSPESLFLAGERVGRRMWNEWRSSILKLGARYEPSVDLIVKTELKPILDKSGKARLTGERNLQVTQVVAPQFVVGLAQGVLNAVSEAAERKISVKIQYVMSSDSVNLTVVM